MSDPDRLPPNLESLLDGLAREDLPGVLADARRSAREQVRARLSDELARRMLASLGDQTAGRERPAEQPPSHDATAAPRDGRTAARPAADAPRAAPPREGTSATGVYVYAVVAPQDGAANVARPGIADAPVRVVESGELAALVSDVSLDEFGDEALKRNLNDLSWVSATAVAHEGVVEGALSGATIVPMRMCTIFRDEAGVRDMLRREAPGLRAALARLRGAQEWGVKAIVDPDAFAAAARDSDTVGELRDTAAASGEGAGYFAALRLDRATREEVAGRLERRTREIHDAVGALATDSRLHPPSNRELSGYEGDMVLNGAYLVAADRADELRALAATLADRFRDEGLTVELTGPWPPYNFSMLAGGL